MCCDSSSFAYRKSTCLTVLRRFAEKEYKQHCSAETGELEAEHFLRTRASARSAVEKSASAVAQVTSKKQKKVSHKKTRAIQMHEKQRNADSIAAPAGNRIVNLNNLTNLIKGLISEHEPFAIAYGCSGDLQLCNETRVSCCSTLFYRCVDCGFESRGYVIFNAVEGGGAREHVRGRKALGLNQRIAMATIATGLSVRNAQLFCCYLDLPSPTSKALSGMIKKAAEAVYRCNEEDMHTIRQSLKERHSRCGVEPNYPVPIEADCRYNIRTGSGGNAPGQPASQIVGIIAENLTPAKKIIAVSQRTKRWQNRQHQPPSNSSDLVPEYEPIGNSEHDIGTDLGRQLASDEIHVQLITTDNDSKLFAGITEGLGQKIAPEKLDCRVHRFRSLYKKLKKCKFKTIYADDTTVRQRGKGAAALAKESRSRLAAEFLACSKKYQGDAHEFSAAMSKIIDACLHCFHDNHDYCVKTSMVCTGRNKGSYKLQYIDKTKSLCMTLPDFELWTKTVKPYFTWQSVSRMRHRTSTNKCESFNNTLSGIIPKGRTYHSSLPGRVANAVLFRNKGVSEAVTSSLAYWNLGLETGSPAADRLEELRRNEIYQKNLHSSKQQKRRKKSCALQRIRRYQSKDIAATYAKDIADKP